MLRVMMLISLVAILMAPPLVAKATCGEDCDTEYQSDVDTCHSNYGDDPAEAADFPEDFISPSTGTTP
jgi:hypothetical protein